MLFKCHFNILLTLLLTVKVKNCVHLIHMNEWLRVSFNVLRYFLCSKWLSRYIIRAIFFRKWFLTRFNIQNFLKKWPVTTFNVLAKNILQLSQLFLPAAISTFKVCHAMHFLKDRSLKISALTKLHRKIEIRKNTGNPQIKNMNPLKELFSSYFNHF